MYSNKLKNKEDFSVEYLKSLLKYDPKSGYFFWKINKSSRARIGRKTGNKNGNGYIILKVDCYRFQAHQIAWLLVKGKWPKKDIDHIDGNRSNNSISNLREATKQQNAWNMKRKNGENIKNTSGTKGVYFNKARKKWEVSIGVGRKIYIGLFSELSDAVLARKKSEKKYHKEYASMQ